MQSYSSKPMRRHDGTVTTQKTQMAKSEIVILMRYNQNEPEFKQSARNYAASKRCTPLCYKVHNKVIDLGGAAAKPPMVKLEKTGTSTSIIDLTEDERKVAEANCTAEELNTLTPLEREWSMHTVVYMDISTGRPESEEKAAVRWAFFKALEAFCH